MRNLEFWDIGHEKIGILVSSLRLETGILRYCSFENGILGYWSFENGILGYWPFEIWIFGIPGPPLTHPYSINAPHFWSFVRE